jgi:eukaryotic-like serine/threonine-protein kinase
MAAVLTTPWPGSRRRFNLWHPHSPGLVPEILTRLQQALADRYRIERELGRGGMASVYLAWDLKHDRPVALKVLRPELAHALGADRFLREIRLCARLQHPHILSIHDSGDSGGQLWFTMPFVEGETLRSRLAREKQLPIPDAIRITTQVADALTYAHQHGVIHRDIKPENILLSGNHALLADFGIARALSGAADGPRDGATDDRLTETGMSLGTPYYMSPEQAAGERELDPRTDVYSLGSVLYEMLAGEPPFTGPNPQAVLAKRLSEPAPHIQSTREVPVVIDRAVTRALARAPADRFSTAAQFVDALRTPSVEPGSSTIAVARPQSPGNRRWISALAGLLLVVLVGYFALGRARGGAPVSAASAAVLPFTDLSPGKDQEYFSDGLTEELITSLSRIEGLRVAARTSSFQFKGQNADVREVGRKLDVGAVLEGSVRKSGDRLRVTAQLSSAKDGYQLWSDSYDRNLADVFAVQEEIARAIVSALSIRLGGRPDSALSAEPTRNLEAYDLYLKGRFAWNQRTGGALKEAVRYLEQAVALDSTFARAWAALSDAYILVVPYAGLSPTETWPKAKAAATRALRLDSTSAEAHTSLAYGTMLYEWNWPAVETSFRRAIAANSNYATAHHWYADFLAGRGRLDESLREMRRAHELDPLSRIIGIELGWVYYLMHRTGEAQEQVRRTLALDRNYAHGYMILGLTQLQAGDPGAAITSLRRASELGDFYPHISGALAVAYAADGDRAAALKELANLRKRASTEYVPPFAFAVIHGGLGEKTQGLEWLERGIAERDIFLPENLFDPLLDPLRGGPRFAQIEKRMGVRR